MFSYLVGIITGVCAPVQTGLNTRLRNVIQSPYKASLVSYGGGFLFTLLIMIISGASFFLPKKIIYGPIWMWLGGIFGVVLVLFGILSMSKLGSVQSVIFTVLGQILTGLILEHFSLFSARSIPLTFYRFLGAILVATGTIIASIDKSSVNKEKSSSQKLSKKEIFLYRFCGLLSGGATACQIPVNAYLTKQIDSTLYTSLITFAVGSLVLILICLFLKIHHPRMNISLESSSSKTSHKSTVKLWMLTGGIFGALIVLANVYLENIFGTGMTVILLLLGQVIGSIVIDAFGFFTDLKKPVTLLKVAGLALMIGGAALVQAYSL